MRLLQNEQLYLLKQKMNEMLTMLNTYDTFATAKFRPVLQRISNNIEQCIRNDFDGIEELSELEDKCYDKKRCDANNIEGRFKKL